HEGGVRSGTVNVPGVVGLAAALQLATDEMTQFSERMSRLRARIEEAFSGVASVNGLGAPRLPHVTNLHFPGVDGSALMRQLQSELAIASGSACTSADPEPSHVLMGMGLSRAGANASLRISLGRYTTDEDITGAISLLREAVKDRS
ncbi:MAG: aminotransferase class V-fold PLP-dependent enzyme, partial [Saprospiraceae bacterium]|nr:aminotransferase class V-fold PLP-dependent enzyme [Saprospiraceae bacterium]